MNHVASTLIPIVDEHSLIVGPVVGDLVSWIWKLKWAWVHMILLLPSLSVLAPLKRLPFTYGMSRRVWLCRRGMLPG